MRVILPVRVNRKVPAYFMPRYSHRALKWHLETVRYGLVGAEATTATDFPRRAVQVLRRL